MSSLSKRTSRPVSERSTADIYGERHGIPEDVRLALQNVGRLKRQTVSMGRALVPTQSLPAFGPNFMSERDTYAAAQGIISKEAMRANELRPYGSIDGLDLAREEAAERGTKRNGEENDRFTATTSTGSNTFASSTMPPPPLPIRATRALPSRGLSKTVSAPVGALGTYSGNQFDPATGNAAIQPGPVAAPFTAGFGGLSPSVSFVEQKEEEEDGFDVSEWAASEEF